MMKYFKLSRNRIWAVFVGLAAVLGATMALVFWNGAFNGRGDRSVMPRPPLPKVGLPGAVPDDQILLPLAPKTALEINALRPFSAAEIDPAAPFSSKLTGADRDRALSCLAVAAVYEAGGSRSDQSAVIQVILNRVRHPAFPKSVCGVVFQGSERATGCQFSFTCDGSIDRWTPTAPTFRRARELAVEMLANQVDRRVGWSTHYHTDWVVPYWSASLVKVAAVKTHLFFRWPGYWGTSDAFVRKVASSEVVVPQIAAFSSAHVPSAGPEAQVVSIEGPVANPVDVENLAAQHAALEHAAAVTRIRTVELDARSSPGRWALSALSACKEQAECRVAGWVDAARVPAQITSASLSATPPDFIFVQQLRNRVQQPYWDCAKWPQASTSKCIGSSSETATLLLGK